MSTTTVKFDIYDGNELVRSEELSEQTIKIGKMSSSHIRIDDEGISRLHAVVEVSGPNKVEILDLSGAGTFVNGDKVRKHQLHSGDQIQLGRFMVVVTIGRPAPAVQQETESAAQSGAHAEAVPTATVAPGPLFDEEEAPDGEMAWSQLAETVEKFSGKVIQCSVDHDAGEQLLGFGGAVALLRYAM